MRLIGITGGVGAGKSEILRYIKKHYSCEIYLADEVAHMVKEPGQPCYEKLLALLGEGMLAADGRIDRGRMAEIVFRDRQLLEQVNGILHPAVKDYLIQVIAVSRERKQTELFFLEAALLLETGYKPLLDEIWYIHADASVRAKRLKSARGYSEEKIKNIMEKQQEEEYFRRECDFMVDNSTTLEEAYRQIDKRLEAYTWQN